MHKLASRPTGTRLAPVLKTSFHLCVISYTCSQSNSDSSKTELSELDWLQVYDMTHWWKIVLRTGASLNRNQSVAGFSEFVLEWKITIAAKITSVN